MPTMDEPRILPPAGEGRRLSVLILLTATAVAVLMAVLYVAAKLSVPGLSRSHRGPALQVDLAPPDKPKGDGPEAGRAGPPSLGVAIAPVISPEKSFQMYKPFVEYLAGRLGRRPRLLHRQTYQEVNDLMRNGHADLAFVCTCAFLRGEREFGMKVLAVPQVGGVVTYHSLFLVPPASAAESLLDLRGKRFASGDTLSTSGWLYPVVWLKERGEAPSRFFREHLITGSHDRSVQAVALNLVDGAAVDSLVYEQMAKDDPSLADKAKVIHRSPPFGMPPFVVPPDLDPATRDALLEALLRMHEDPRGREILAPLRIERFVVPPAGLYDSVRRALAAWEAQER